MVNQNQGNLDSLAGNIRGYLPGLAEKAFGQDAGLDAARGYATDVLGGKYLGQGNPYLNDMIRISGENVANDVNSRFGASGRSLGGAHAGVLGQKLMDSQLGLRYTDYTNERGAMERAAGMMPSLTAAEVARVAPYLAATEMAGTLPYAGIGNLTPIIGLANGAGTTTSKQSSPWGPALLGGISSGISAALSDERAKEQIERVGTMPNGLGIYDFNYKADVGPAGRYRGVMAQEVARIAPEMLGPPQNGYMTVYYQPERIG